MKASLKKREGIAGFTLIEMAIVMVIVGIIISIVTTVMPAMVKSGKIGEGRAILERHDYALKGYFLAHGNCPCPDTDGDGLEDRTTGATPPSDDTCDSYVGNLPYRTLGLSGGEDNWHNPIKYSVYEDLIRTTLSSRCASLGTIISYYAGNSADTAKLHTTDSKGSVNQAYFLASGGPSDLDGSNGFFDAKNGNGDLEFEVPDRIVDASYDDLVRSGSFAYLSGKSCSADDFAGSGGSESTYANGCSNGVDDDGDTYIDCLDQDCDSDDACTGGGGLTITTASIPPGGVNGPYTTTFQATGGTTPYEWTLTANGGFSAFFLHTYTGQLSGPLDQSAGIYSITVQVEDSTAVVDGGPTTDTKTFNLQVTN